MVGTGVHPALKVDLIRLSSQVVWLARVAQQNDLFSDALRCNVELGARIPATGARHHQQHEVARAAAAKWLEGKTVQREIVVPCRIVNFVAK